MASRGKKLQSLAQDENDPIEYRKRVATYVDGTSVAYEDTNFTSAESPIVLDVYTDLGRIGHEGHIINDGPGNILVEISTDGTNYGGQHTLKGGEPFDLENLSIKKIRLTYVDPTAYRALIA